MEGHAGLRIYAPEFASHILPTNGTVPFYYTDKPSLIAGVPDKLVALLSPVVGYWVLSILFHALDTWGENWEWLKPYRIHESEEVRSKNLVTKWQVIKTVLVQHAVQTLLGYLALEGDEVVVTDHKAQMVRLSPILVQGSLLWLGDPLVAQAKLEKYGPTIIHFVYWWLIPTAQIIFAFLVIDTWQYFWHRYGHTNKFLYRHIHSWHHRLYVPYAFGAMYNHPVEGFVLDSLGTVVAQFFARLTTRQNILMFTFAILKTVDDHCGYALPFDPLQIIFSNNADYHDIHHQTIGIKRNFAQPFFIHWDVIMGTRMTRKEVEAKVKKPHEVKVVKENGNAKENGIAYANGHPANGDRSGNREKVE